MMAEGKTPKWLPGQRFTIEVDYIDENDGKTPYRMKSTKPEVTTRKYAYFLASDGFLDDYAIPIVSQEIVICGQNAGVLADKIEALLDDGWKVKHLIENIAILVKGDDNE